MVPLKQVDNVCTNILRVESETMGPIVNNNYTFSEPLDDRHKYHMFWTYDQKWVTIRVQTMSDTNDDWFAVGFSPDGLIGGSDMCILWTDTTSHYKLQDIHVDSDGIGLVDTSNDCHLINATKLSNGLSFAFKRAFNTCDPIDYTIEEGTTNMVWSTGSGLLIDRIDFKANKYGFRPIRLMNIPERISPDLPKAKTYDFLNDDIPVPVLNTSWQCTVHRLPMVFYRKHHIVKYEPIIEAGNYELVHHMKLIMLKDAHFDNQTYLAVDCDDQRLQYMDQISAWANGSKAFSYPDEAGVPIGGQSGHQYLLLQTHYHNLALTRGLRDNSGLRIHVVSKLRQYDAGLLKIGMDDFGQFAALPGNRSSVDLSVYMSAECSAQALPPHGITVFAQQFHTHQRRTRVRTQHVRQGRELSVVNWDEHCNFEYLEIMHLKHRVNVLPGDALVHTCRYDTTKKPVAPDIMCSTFLHYYPAVNLKWVINDMHTYIDFMAHHMSYSEQELHDNRPPMAERCDQLSGDSYSGNWTAIPVPKIIIPLPPAQKFCTRILTTVDKTHTKQAIDYVEKYIENPVRLSLILSVAIILLFIIIFLSFQCLTRAERRAEALYAYRKVYTKRDLNFEKFPNLLAEEKVETKA
ncbi:unnamed protein product, partial [Medioppia subpectinata]